jgi:hypothetical protein
MLKKHMLSLNTRCLSSASSENESKNEGALIQILEAPYQFEPPINHLKWAKFKKSSAA